MLQDFARRHKYEETVVALAAMTGVPIDDADRMMASDRPDSILILCKALGFDWPTLRAMLALRIGPGRAPSSAEIPPMKTGGGGVGLRLAALAPLSSAEIPNTRMGGIGVGVGSGGAGSSVGVGCKAGCWTRGAASVGTTRGAFESRSAR